MGLKPLYMKFSSQPSGFTTTTKKQLKEDL